ncbi:hypothetical protein [Halobacterium zhouii]|uniref:DUF7835 family putative zinc beta-ribbon protein n=1 Tax=Halobacterium zhouii TaxID=2902624 RepID=UPI001E4B8843|nr:hypothetical protein [Halobacterium zhouii]
MTTTTPNTDVREFCDVCDKKTAHAVQIELRVESTKTENQEFSREPYRVSTCADCESTSTMRMNHV